MRVHQVTGAAGSYDAVTEQMVAYSSLLEEWGLAGGAHATIVAPGSPRGIESLDRLRPAADDLLLIHYAGYVPGMRPLLDLPQRKLLVYHNVTPARYFWRVEPRVALTCQLGRRHLPRWIAAARSTAAVSAFNAHELREMEPRTRAWFRSCSTPRASRPRARTAAAEGPDRWCCPWGAWRPTSGPTS